MCDAGLFIVIVASPKPCLPWWYCLLFVLSLRSALCTCSSEPLVGTATMAALRPQLDVKPATLKLAVVSGPCTGADYIAGVDKQQARPLYAYM